MKLQKYLKSLQTENSESFGKRQLYDRYKELNIEIFLQNPDDWQADFSETVNTGKMYYEICGPRISKEQAMRMAAQYNWPRMAATFGPICCYHSELHKPDNYGVFKLDGAVGLYGSTWTHIGRVEVLDGVLDLVLENPDFEFAVFFAGKYLEKTAKEEQALETEFETRIGDVRYGFRYDPAAKRLDVLGRRAAWRAVKSYQALYTKEERKLFFPWESGRYYAQDPKGKEQLAEFMEYQKSRPQPAKEPTGKMELGRYIGAIAEPRKIGNDDALWEISRGFDLTVYLEDRMFLDGIWLRSMCGAKRPYFEMCGPKIENGNGV